MRSNLHKHFKTKNTPVLFAVDDKIKFLMKHFSESNSELKRVLDQKLKPFARQISMGTFPPEKDREIMLGIFCTHILVGWEGVENADTGEAIPFSPKAATDLLKDLPELFETILQYSRDFQNFKEDLEIVGNSSATT